MDDRADFVDEFEDVLLEDVVDFSEFANVTKSKYRTLLLTLKHWIHITLLYYILANNLRPCTTKHNTQ